MRWKLLRRRLSVSAPRMTVRRQLPWPLRWAIAALVLGFSAALALWAFEFGKDIAGLDRDAKAELTRVRDEVGQLRSDSDKARSVADTSGSLLKAERTTLERLAQQVRQLENENLSLKADLGFFERLLPTNGSDGLTIRGLQADLKSPGQLRYQLLVMQGGKIAAEFAGHYDLTLIGTVDGHPWSLPAAGGAQALRVRQYARVEGLVVLPLNAVVKTVQVRITDASGAIRATQALRL
jgi:exonuclease VII small subunit